MKRDPVVSCMIPKLLVIPSTLEVVGLSRSSRILSLTTAFPSMSIANARRHQSSVEHDYGSKTWSGTGGGSLFTLHFSNQVA